MNKTIDNKAIAGMSQHRSPAFVAAYLGMMLSHRMPGTAIMSMVTWEEQNIIHKAWARFEEDQSKPYISQEMRKKAMLEFFNVAKSVSKIRKYRKFIKLMSHFDDYIMSLDRNQIATMIAGKGKKDIQIYIGSYAKRFFNYNPPYHDKGVKPLHDQLPLYACSGELEADEMNYHMIIKLSRGASNCSGYWKQSDKLNFSRDGGGQRETQFHIDPVRAKIVCGLVTRLGGHRRNGGHIHINCKYDYATGKRVFDALRYHLSWTRWLVSGVRRNHTWAPVSGTEQTFDRAIGHKQAAVTANTWHRTGTVEMRVWGTTNKPEEWLGRAKLMQAIAKWSEAFNCTPNDTPYPITMDTAHLAWPQFFSWASRNAPEGLCYALKTMRKKLRMASTASVDKQACEAFLTAWEQSGRTCRGYRTRQPVSRPATIDISGNSLGIAQPVTN